MYCMDSFNVILGTYERIANIVSTGNYFFHVTDSNIDYSDISYDEFIHILPKIEYIDSTTDNYTKVYLSPFTRTILLLCARKAYEDNKLMLIKIPRQLIDTIYIIMHDGISREYSLTLDAVHKRISDLEKVEYNEQIQLSDGRDGTIYDDEAKAVE